MTRRVTACDGEAGQSRSGEAGRGAATLGVAVTAWFGKARVGSARHGMAFTARGVKARRGVARQGSRGVDGTARGGKARLHLRMEPFPPPLLSGGGVGGSVCGMTEDANVTDEVIEELDKIAKDDMDGLIQPERVIEVASDETSPLHRHFEWDDSEAAYEYRLVQARKLIRSVTIIRVDSPPRYVNVTIKRVEGGYRRGYVQTEKAVVDPDLYEQVVMDASKGIRAYQSRLQAFTRARKAADLLGKAIEELTESVNGDKEN